MDITGMRQRCYTYDPRELATKLGLVLSPSEWVVVEVDGESIDVMIRKNVPVERNPE